MPLQITIIYFQLVTSNKVDITNIKLENYNPGKHYAVSFLAHLKKKMW